MIVTIADRGATLLLTYTNGHEEYIVKSEISSINWKQDEVVVFFNTGFNILNYTQVTNPLTNSAQELADQINDLL